MRLWSLNFEYLDTKGLVALWREALLAKKVLEGKTKGYKNHPQLNRFKSSKDPLVSINTYLYYVHQEAIKRGYNFSSEKVNPKKVDETTQLPVTRKQLAYEFNHLMEKLEKRDIEQYKKIKDKKRKQCNKLFYLVVGEIESWEIISPVEKRK